MSPVCTAVIAYGGEARMQIMMRGHASCASICDICLLPHRAATFCRKAECQLLADQSMISAVRFRNADVCACMFGIPDHAGKAYAPGDSSLPGRTGESSGLRALPNVGHALPSLPSSQTAVQVPWSTEQPRMLQTQVSPTYSLASC